MVILSYGVGVVGVLAGSTPPIVPIALIPVSPSMLNIAG
jgi:hypothetical protein